MRRSVWHQIVFHHAATISLASACACWVYCAQADPFIPSQQTTYFTEPLHEDGTINYLAAINALGASNAANKDNFAIDLARSMPAASWPSTKYRTKLYQQWGLKPPVDFRYALQPNVISTIETFPDFILTRPWRDEESPESVRFIAQNSFALNHLLESMGQKQFFWPMVEKTRPSQIPVITSLLPQLSQLRGVAYLLISRANLKAGREQYEGGMGRY